MELPDEVLKKLYYKNALKLVKGLPTTGFPEEPRRAVPAKK